MTNIDLSPPHTCMYMHPHTWYLHTEDQVCFTSPLCWHLIEYDIYIVSGALFWEQKKPISNYEVLAYRSLPQGWKKLKSFHMDRLYPEATWQDLGHPNNHQHHTEAALYETSDHSTSQPLSLPAEDLGDREHKWTVSLFAEDHKGSLYAIFRAVGITTAIAQWCALAPACRSISCSLAQCPQVHPSCSLKSVPSCLLFSSSSSMIERSGMWHLQTQVLFWTLAKLRNPSELPYFSGTYFSFVHIHLK